MKLNTLVWGFEKASGEAILKKLASNPTFNVVKWISDCRDSDSVYEYFRCSLSADDDILAPDVYDYCFDRGINVFINMFSRHYQNYSWTYHDYMDAFNINLRKVARLLSQDTGLVIFSNIPHEGPDFLLYLLAKRKGIKTLFFYQSLFNNKFFITTNIEDFGTFANVPNQAEYQKVTIEKKHAEQYFYMKGIAPINYNTPEYGKYFKMLIKRSLPDLGIHLVKNNRFNIFVRCLNTATKEIALEKLDYVYFPLALQPELTTSAIGGIYNDQVLAVERLSQMLPAGWKILVKENPKQTDFQRGFLFFRRLSSLSNVQIVPIEYDTHLLTQHSKFVAVVTGTAGWEAIKGGKVALVFGNPWFKNLPGVISYHQNLTFSEVINHSFDHTQLEIGHAHLLQKCGTGIVDDVYKEQVKDFEINTNAERVVDSIVKVVCDKRTLW